MADQKLSVISDNQAEAGVIATLMYHPDFILHTDYLKPSYFFNVENGCIYWAIEELYKEGVKTIDAMNISNMLNSNKSVKHVMEKHNLTDMNEFISLAALASRDTLEEYKLLVKRVVDLAYRRDLSKVSGEIQARCFDTNLELSKLTNIVNQKMDQLTESYILSDKIESFGNRVDDLWDLVVSQRSGDGYIGIPSKIKTLNDYVTFIPGELVLLTARMKQGKSAYFMNEAIHKIKNNVPTLYIDTEMSDLLFFKRMLANITGIPIRDIERGMYTDDDAAVIEKARKWIKTRPFVHQYMPEVDLDKVFAYNKILKNSMGLQFSIYDYIKCNESDSSTNYNLLGSMTDFLKNSVAGKLDIAVLAGAQLNRENKVADSDKINRYVSTSIRWRNKTMDERSRDGEECGNYMMHVDLNRNGPQHDENEWIDVNFDGSRMRISEAQQHVTVDTPFDDD